MKENKLVNGVKHIGNLFLRTLPVALSVALPFAGFVAYVSKTETQDKIDRQIRNGAVTMQISPTEEYLLKDTSGDGRVDEVYAHHLRSYFKGRHPEPAYRASGYTPSNGMDFPEGMPAELEARVNEFYIAHQNAKDLFVRAAQ